MFGASEDPLHALVLERGQRALAAGRSARARRRRPRGPGAGRPRDRPRRARRRTARSSWPSTRWTTSARGRRARVLPAGHRAGVRDVSASTAKAWATCSTRSRVQHVPRAAAAPDGRQARDAGDDSEPDEPADARRRPTEVAVAIVGRPNAGKSSLVNRLLREERMIVSEMPGTTRDSVDTVLTWHKRQFRIVDTAGMRRPGPRGGSRGRSSRSACCWPAARWSRRTSSCWCVDATAGATDQDAAIAGEADRLGRGIIIVANKWDLMKGQGPDFVQAVRRASCGASSSSWTTRPSCTCRPPPASARRSCSSHRPGGRVPARRASRRTQLNTLVERISPEHPPQSPGRRHVRILYAAQTAWPRRRSSSSPTSRPASTSPTSASWSTSCARRSASKGTPIRLQVRARRAKAGRARAGAPDIACYTEQPDDTEAVPGGRRLRPGAAAALRAALVGEGVSRHRRPEGSRLRRGSTGSPTSIRCCASSSWCSARG